MNDLETTKILVQRYQAGDTEALNDLCTRYWLRIHTAVRHRLGVRLRQRVGTSDIVQDVFQDVLAKLDSFDYESEGAFVRFVNRVVTNRIRDEADFWAAKKRNPDRELPIDQQRADGVAFDLPDGSFISPSRLAAQREDLEQMEMALDLLGEESDEQRDLIVAVKLEGLSCAELAVEQGVSTDSIRMKVARAESKLAIIFRRLNAREQ